MKTVLVTGGAGYIGSHTCKALAEQGATVVAYDNLSEGHAEFVQWGELIEGDVADTAGLIDAMQTVQPDAVIHFAASAYVGESVQHPQRYYENNVAGSLSLLSAMRESGCSKLVFSSTCAVYGEVENLPISIATDTKPINPYGRSKLMIEQILRDVAPAHGISSVAFRYFNAAGASNDGSIGERHIPETHLIPNVINAVLLGGEPLKVFGTDYPTKDGTCIRDYIHVSDLAAGHLAALDYLHENSGHHVFNLGSGQGVSIRQVIEEVGEQMSQPVPVLYADRRPGDPAELTADITGSIEQLAWQPQHSSLSNIIQTAINWARMEMENNI